MTLIKFVKIGKCAGGMWKQELYNCGVKAKVLEYQGFLQLWLSEQPLYLLPLEHQDWVCEEVWHVYSLALADHIWVFAQHEPANMREEEASVGVVGVCISLAVLVMDSVVASPFVHAVLQSRVWFVQRNWYDVGCLKWIGFILHVFCSWEFEKTHILLIWRWCVCVQRILLEDKI